MAMLREQEIRFYLNSIRKGDRILIIDDVMSRGGTMISIIEGLEKAGAVIRDAVVVIDRGNGPQRVKEETGYDVKTLADVELRDGKLNILKILEIE
jgi:adenine phosphoribosyltransferase